MDISKQLVRVQLFRLHSSSSFVHPKNTHSVFPTNTCAVVTSKQEAAADSNHGDEAAKRTVQLDQTEVGAAWLHCC